MNKNNPLNVKAEKLVAQMSLAEKASLCSGADFWSLKSCERLSLPSIMVTDGPHGLRKQRTENSDHLGLFDSVPATCFPTAVALASSWDSSLLMRVGEALAAECLEEDVAVLLGPGINIKRHPLGGRNFEYLSEDPLLSGKMSAALINGIQSKGVGSSLKHYAVNNQEAFRMTVDAVVDERTLNEIYLRGFEIAIKESSPWTVMCAYNRLNGVYCSENTWLTEDVLRGRWHYDGLVVSDWGATDDRVRGIVAGMDLEMPGNQGQNDNRVVAAVEAGQLDIKELDKVARRVTKLILRATEGRERAKSSAVPLDHAAHHQLAREAASKSAVLLKNENDLLPLTSDVSIAVVGEFARKPRYQGCGSSLVTPTKLDTAWDALQTWAEKNDVRLTFAAGYDVLHSKDNLQAIDEAVNLAKRVDIVLVFAGLPDMYESEGIDRPHCELPNQQNKLIEAVSAVNTSTIVVLSNGASVAMPWLRNVDAVLECYLSGQAGGSAVVDLLAGVANPSGKLAETFAIAQSDHLSDAYFPGHVRQVEYREGLYVGYRYFNTVNKPVLFPFGFGLSYTTFTLSGASLSETTYAPVSSNDLVVQGQVANTGAMDGEEVIQVYVKALDSKIHRPAQVLAGFAKMAVAQGGAQRYEIVVDDRSFGFYCVKDQRWKIETGEYEIQIGSSSRDIGETLFLQVHGEGIAPDQSPEQTFFSNLNTGSSTVPDSVFSSALGKAIPAVGDARPFHRNSTFADIQLTWIGKMLVSLFSKKMKAELGTNKEDEQENIMIDRALPALPLRGIVQMSEGKVSFRQLDALIYLLNGRYIKAIGRMLTRA